MGTEPAADKIGEADGNMLGGTLPIRHAARVVLLDGDGCVLLMRYDHPPPNGKHWATPGGGIEAGENHRQAAQRELFEETGWSDIVLRQEILQHGYDMAHHDRMVHQVERLYLARIDDVKRPIRGVAAMHIADGIAAWRWWSLSELDHTDEAIWPRGLVALIRTSLCPQSGSGLATAPAHRHE